MYFWGIEILPISNEANIGALVVRDESSSCADVGCLHAPKKITIHKSKINTKTER